MYKGIFLLLGSNIGDRQHHLSKARAAIHEHLGPIEQSSGIYVTAPWGNTRQQPFYNQVLKISSSTGPHPMLEKILSIESMLGRQRTNKWGPRTIDIDILFFGDMVVESPSLTIPHPRIPDRRFTLIPLNEIAPDFIHPVLLKSVAVLLDSCSDALAVEKVHD